MTDDRDLTIDTPLVQPAALADFVEGGSFAFLIEHRGRTILVQVPSDVIGVLDDVRADVLFLSVIPIGHDDQRHTDTFYRTDGRQRPPRDSSCLCTGTTSRNPPATTSRC